MDDEVLARQVLRELLQSHPEIHVLAECANGFEAVKAVTEHKPDLIFLDVQMPKLSGFDVLELIEGDIAVIFTTAYDQYAMKAFEVHAVDYLLKPIGGERFESALDRVKKRDRRKMHSAASERCLPMHRDHSVATTADRTRPPRPTAAAISRARRRARRHACHADPHGETRLRRSSGRLHRARRARRETSQAANHRQHRNRTRSRRFVRIHRSYIVNFERVVRIEPYGKDSRLRHPRRRHAPPGQPHRLRAIEIASTIARDRRRDQRHCLILTRTAAA